MPAGGLRTRLIKDSLYWTIRGGLTDLGWFSTTMTTPITFLSEPVDTNEKIEFNTLVLSGGDLHEFEAELGSTAAETVQTFYVDFFAENDSVGTELIHDVRAIVAGRHPSIGRTHARVEILDYRLATPSFLFGVDVENVNVDRAHDFPKPWLKHWHSCWFDIRDEDFG